MSKKKEKRPMNYVGVTGISDPLETREVLDIVEMLKVTDERKIMLGFLASSDFWDVLDYGNSRKPDIFHLIQCLKALDGEDVFTTIHFHSKNGKDFANDLITLLSLTDVYRGKPIAKMVNGIQLNIIDPSPREMGAIKERFPHLELILQFESLFFEKYSKKGFEKFQQIVDHVLFDRSRGKGIELNFSEKDEKIIHEIKKEGKVNIGFAGGLSPQNTEKIITTLQEKFGTMSFSIDAESGLRTENRLDSFKVRAYLKKAFQCFGRRKEEGLR